MEGSLFCSNWALSSPITLSNRLLFAILMYTLTNPGQVVAILLGISRALQNSEPDLRSPLKEGGRTIEKDLVLIESTAIEDKLEGVPACIVQQPSKPWNLSAPTPPTRDLKQPISYS